MGIERLRQCDAGTHPRLDERSARELPRSDQHQICLLSNAKTKCMPAGNLERTPFYREYRARWDISSVQSGTHSRRSYRAFSVRTGFIVRGTGRR